MSLLEIPDELANLLVRIRCAALITIHDRSKESNQVNMKYFIMNFDWLQPIYWKEKHTFDNIHYTKMKCVGVQEYAQGNPSLLLTLALREYTFSLNIATFFK